ncbi:MAG: radical SAM protein, partial [Clostridia bacterium]|nr:radical SAM protein [Clostridia bacterium]
HTSCGERIAPLIAAEAVRKIASKYDIKTVMTFGGEPLLYTDAVYAVMTVAKEVDIPKRQVITNGYFSHNSDKIREVAQRLSACGVNDLLLSVDAFHQETIPLHIVKQFAAEAKKCAIPVRLSPAWLVSAADDNPYNKKTREILDSFDDLELPIGDGNVIFPEGNALKYLAEYFTDERPESPYFEDPWDVRCVSFEPCGGVLGENVYERDILEIIADYAP